jgi:hypothetical protein
MDDWDDTDDEWPEEADDDEENVVVACPACGAEMYEDAVRCPVCGEYVTHGHSAWEGRPLWWIVLGGVGIVAVIVVLSAM